MTDNELKQAKQAAKAALRDIDGVQGIAIADDQLRIYVRDEEVSRHLPPSVRGVPVNYIATGEFRHFGAGASSSLSTADKQ